MTMTMMTEEDENGHLVEKGKEELEPVLAEMVEQGVLEELVEQELVIIQKLNKSGDQKDWLM
jgi:hypothetical protein